MDLVESGKKDRSQAEEELRNDLSCPIDDSQKESDTEAPFSLLQYFSEFDFASEEDYIQGGSQVERTQIVETVQWLTFFLGAEEYALSLDVVLELIKPRVITALPDVPDYVCGILSLRGVIVPIIDLRKRLNLGAEAPSDHQRIIICEGRDQSIGILVDRITQVVRLAVEEIEPPPLTLNEREKNYISGVGRSQGRMLIQLKPEAVLKI